MGPRRRGKGASSAARNAAIQAVKRQRQQEDDVYDEDEVDDDLHDHAESAPNGNAGGGAPAKGNGNSNSGGSSCANSKNSSAVAVPGSNNHHGGNCSSGGGNNGSNNAADSTALALPSDSEPPPLVEDDASVIDNCLHCHRYANDVQVRCDECHAYICQTCHWCHEFQANHEIRVCDRCDAFYCRNCDEMDQCDDCGEVVCASCSTLLSCKFCGGGLCEECATACGRCGIVLCSRDAKFAVDCDTCRLSYCLVCLASGSKDPCVRCGHRPSKRMEQLVHLRLKSIYKAFKQSSRSPSSKDGASKINFSSNPPEFITDADDDDGVLGDVDNPHLLLQAAASAASSSAKAARAHLHSNSHHHSSHHHHPPHPPTNNASAACGTLTKDLPPGDLATTDQAKELVDRYMVEKEKADAAAEALLAELEEEEEAIKSKKSKKKKKKERQLAKRDDEKKDSPPPSPRSKPKTDPSSKQAKQPNPPQEATVRTTEAPPKNTFVIKAKSAKLTSPKLRPTTENNSQADSGGEEEWMVSKSKHSNKTADTQNSSNDTQADPLDQRLNDLVDQNDVDGIEELLFTLKGVPGRSTFRKNAKKALKRIRQASEDLAEAKAASEAAVAAKVKAKTSPLVSVSTNEPTIKHNPARRDVNPRPSSSARPEPTKTEFVMRVSPFMVGWIIGRGGQRIRDLMEESGAKIWIDQNNASPQDQRSVYVNGTQKCVDHASRLLKDLIANGPPGQAPAPASLSVPVLASALAPKLAELISPVQAPQIEKSAIFVPPGATSHPFAHPSVHLAVPPDTITTDTDDTLHVVECEPRFVPLLIGRRGWAIKNIQDTSGARVDIDQSTSPRKIRISGTESNVQTAVGMVNDVLRYPHAQLQFDYQENLSQPLHHRQLHYLQPHIQEQEIEPSSPPSSLIMTGDLKTSISASSSLSSTPEPSMSVVKPQYGQIQPGVLFSTGYDVNGGGTFVHPSEAAQNPAMTQALDQAISSPTSNMHLYAGRLNGMAVPSQQPGFGLPPTYNHHTHLSYGNTISEPTALNPNPFVDDFQGPSSPSFLSCVNTLGVSNLSSGLGASPGAHKSAPWNEPSPLFAPQSSVTDNYGLGVVSLPPRLPVTDPTTAFAGGNLFASHGDMDSGDFHDDSHIVDSLFAPQRSGDIDNTQSLLSGLKGLSIDGVLDNDGNDIWGSTLAAAWKPDADPVARAPNATNGSILLAGLQSLNSGVNTNQDIYHPSQSRFDWGSSTHDNKNKNNASVGHA